MIFLPCISKPGRIGFVTLFPIGLTACTALAPVKVEPATQRARVVVPEKAVITGERGESALGSLPELPTRAIAELRSALEASGHTVVTKAEKEAGAETDLAIADVTVKVERLAVTVVTGEYAHLSGSLRVTPVDQPTRDIEARSQPVDTRYYPPLEEATQRLMQNLVNQLNQPEADNKKGTGPTAEATPNADPEASSVEAPTPPTAKPEAKTKPKSASPP